MNLNLKTVIVIPARFGSTRFPGKPLALIHGKSLLHRTWSIAKAIQHVDEVYIATDDARIQEHAKNFGAKTIRTPIECENGTERVFAAIQQLSPTPDIILNLQGDAVLTPPWIIQPLLNTMLEDTSIALATPANLINLEQYQKMLNAKKAGAVGGTTVVFDKNQYALYFSKSMIPFVRDTTVEPLPLYKHIGLYAYRYETLKKYLELKPSSLEKTEGLEQLRALENGIKIKIVIVDYKQRTHWAVDSPEDISIVENIIAKEGELIT